MFHFELWSGANCVDFTTDPIVAIEWMIEIGEKGPDPECALIVTDGKGMAKLALVDARVVPIGLAE